MVLQSDFALSLIQHCLKFYFHYTCFASSNPKFRHYHQQLFAFYRRHRLMSLAEYVSLARKVRVLLYQVLPAS